MSFEIRETPYVLHRRFDRMGRLVGDAAMEKIFRAHIMVFGLGGVGSWAAESLARSGVGRLTLVDFDEICITNVNRQLHAVQGMVGRKKAEAMAERLRKINPQAVIEAVPQFYNAENSAELLARRPDSIVDAIDNLTAKAHLISVARGNGLTLVSSMGASGRMDPTAVRLVDLAETHNDPFAHQLRKMLRQKYDFPADGPWGIPCAFSAESPVPPEELHYDHGEGFKCVCPQGQNDLHSCLHRNVVHGNAGFVTGAFGLALASHVVRSLIGPRASVPAPVPGSGNSADGGSAW